MLFSLGQNFLGCEKAPARTRRHPERVEQTAPGLVHDIVGTFAVSSRSAVLKNPVLQA